MAAPVGSLRDLEDLLEGRGSNILEQRPFPFYSVLLYTPSNSLNQRLHEYVVSRYELFNKQTGPNWLVAVVEDIPREHSIAQFRPQDVYEIARYLGARVDDIPAIVFFTEPKERNDTLVLKLGDILSDPRELRDEDLTGLFGKIAAIIDDICQSGEAKEDRLAVLGRALKREWAKDPAWGSRVAAAVDWLKMSAAAATTVLGAISGIARLLSRIGLY